MTHTRAEIRTMDSILRIANSLEKIEKTIVKPQTKEEKFDHIITLCKDFNKEYGWQEFKEIVRSIDEIDHY